MVASRRMPLAAALAAAALAAVAPAAVAPAYAHASRTLARPVTLGPKAVAPAAAVSPSRMVARQAAARGTAVGVSAREFRLGVFRASAPRGVVRFNLTNYGEDTHNLVIRTRLGREVARSREVRSGQRTTLRVRLAPGRYRLVCDIADHERRGMRAAFRVTEKRPR